MAFEDLPALDSIGVVQMVSDVEASVGVEFTPEDMRSAGFRTVGGLLIATEVRWLSPIAALCFVEEEWPCVFPMGTCAGGR